MAAGCGFVADPLPPALNIPMAVRDLRAIQYGDNILVDFTLPKVTTDNLQLKQPPPVELWVGPNVNPFNIDTWAAGAKKYELNDKTREVPVSEWAGKEVVLSVRAIGPKGKPSAWSNPWVMTPGSPLEQPGNLKADNVQEGVKLTWRGTGPHYRVYRTAGEGMRERFAETDKPEYVDETTEYGTRYQYLIQAYAEEMRQSLPSNIESITPVDTFPPAVPGALIAIAGVRTIELTWTRNAEPDFKGYNVYRAQGSGPFQKIASLVEAPAYSDSKVEPGKRYRYAITAVDVTGNESGQSNPQEAAAQ
jgi:hypothetical protein